MINYFIEFAIINLLLIAVYKLLLQRETNLSFRRTYLLGATILSFILPLITIPVSTAVTPMDITGTVSTIILPEFTLKAAGAEQSWLTQLPWYNYIFLIISFLVITRLLIAVIRIILFYIKSDADEVLGTKIRHLSGLNSVFTFLNWIFLDRNKLADSHAIIKHEEAHIKFGHSYDLIFLNLTSVIFWWLPSIWATLHEIKDIHEFQADGYAAKATSHASYKRTIINYALTNQGIILTNSFNDTELIKRLNFMKQLKRKVSAWKIVSVMVMISLTIYMFSCQEAVNDEFHLEDEIVSGEVYQKVEVMPEFPGGMSEYYNYIANSIVYPEEAKKAGISGKVFVEMIITDKGKVSNVTALRGVGYGLDKEAIRVVKASPEWTPGTQDDKAVNVKLVLPIGFKLRDDQAAAGVASQKEMPTFPGGKEALFQYLQSNIKYPEEAHKNGIEGKVLVEFLVDSDGAVKNANVKVGFDPACDAEALRIVESLPNWEPIQKAGKPVPSTMVLPIVFRLN